MQDTLIQGFQLSPQQRHLWLLTQHDHRFLATAQSAILLEGTLDVDRLRTALQQLVEQHEILHTTFRLLPGMPEPLQVIDDAEIAWGPEHNLRNLPDHTQMAAFDQLFDEAYQQPIDCGQAPVLHASLVTFADDRHALLLRLPALCADRRTLTNLTLHLSRAYAALGTASEAGLDEPIQYVVVSDWLNELLESEDAEPGKRYWRQHAFVNAPIAKLPFESTSGSTGATPYAPIHVTISPEQVRVIEATAQAHDTSLDAFLLTCWQVLLWRMLGSNDVVVGTAFDGRADEDLAETLGLFTKYVPVSSQPRGELRFAELLQHLTDEISDAAAWQECFAWDNFSTAGQAGAQERLLAFGFDVEPRAEQYAADDLLFTEYRQRVNADQFQVKLACTNTSAGLEALIDYDPRLFARADIERMARSFVTLVEAAVGHEQSPISRLELLDPQDRQQLLVAFNPQPADVPVESCLPELFEAQVARTPEQVALVLGEQALTYAELNRRANHLAHHLQSLGVGPEVFVALYLERSIDMIVGLLAVLKAGGVYAPLDPDYPQERLQLILDQLQPPVILTHQQLAGKLPRGMGQVICLDESAWPENDEPIARTIHAHNLAYVIFTSGSTGAPKGVLVSHAAIAAHVLAARDYYGLTPDDRMLQFAVFHFDASLDQILPPLLSGATIVLRGHEVWDAVTCARVISEQNLSVINLPTAYWHQMTREWAATTAPRSDRLRLAIVGGEALLPEYLRLWQTMFGADIQVLNAYGPTEAAVTATTCSVFDLTGDESFDQGVPIGYPLGQRTAYILDRYGNPMPIGGVGELYLGGLSLARGYLGQAALTAERFVPDPFGPIPGSRLYKTGDLARYLPDGRILFIGRADRQIKVRGFRVELTEIEAAISRHPAVGETIVLARQVADNADKHLIAYLVAVPGQQVTATELRNFLLHSLPEYMVPGDMVFLEEFPLTPNGKVDRSALPDLETLKAAQRQAYVAPRTAVEEALAEIWADVFKIEHVGVYDNFFDLGGHSLIATQLIARVRSVLRVEVSLRSLMNAPTIAGLARTVEQTLREARGVPAPPLVPTSRTSNTWPPSFAQQRLWFLQQFEPNSPAYNMPGRIRIRGALNQAALTDSLATIIQRHEVLRTTFALVDGQPVQVIAPLIEWQMAQEDLRHLAPAEREAMVAELTTQDAAQLFDLENGPLLRATLLRLAEAEYVLLLTMHHIVADERSINIFVQELSELYEAFAAGKAAMLPELSLQYADVAIWQRDWFQGAALDAQMAYWKAQLGGAPGPEGTQSGTPAPALLDLPTDRPRPATQTFHGASQQLRLSADLTGALRSLSRRHETTLFMTLLAAFQVLLSRYSRQDDIVVGSPIVSRTQTETEGLIGCFINTLVLRADLSGDPTFRDVLARVREVTLGAYAHQDLPFEKLVEELQPERDLSRHPLFQVMFTLQHQAVTELTLPDLELSVEPIESETTKFDLTLMLIDGETISGSLEYNTDLFDATTIQRLIGHFERLLEACVANPEQHLSDLVLLDETERQQILHDWNNTAVEYPQDVCLHTLIEQQVTRTPDATALVFEDASLSYAELNARANQLAQHLRSLGVGAETPVAVCMERSLELVIALLGVLKAGGAYVPVDPGYPSDRIQFMLADAAAPVLLTQQRLEPLLPPHNVRVLRLDADWSQIAQQPTSNPALVTDATNLAYVIYTSGSTGQPKGAMNTHAAIVNRLLWMQDVFQLDASDRVVQKTPFSFDVSVWEFFWPLLSGATLVVAKPGGHQDSAYLVDLIARERITTLHFVPSMLHVFLEEPQLERCQSLRRVICSGEALPLALQERFFTRLQAELHNLYGPTEAAVDVTWWPCQPQSGVHTVPIGRPIANTEIYILDPQLRPVPVGVPGELHIGGVQLARGYLNRPALSAEKFIPDPFSHPEGTRPNARLYKTGDLARFLSDGAIEYLGRLDFQVKLRGFRIELGEIETALGQHPQIREVVVLARQDAPDETRLVAYVVGEQGNKGTREQSTADSPSPITQEREQEPATVGQGVAQAGDDGLTVAELRRFLAPKLPEYMIPAVFVPLAALPLSPNGKVDRRALPAPDAAHRASRVEYIAPRTPLESELARIWAEVLGLEQVGVYDNFFDLGGHSLKAIQVLSRVRDSLQVDVSLHRLFQSPVIADFARSIEQSENRPTEPAPIKPLSRQARRVRVDSQANPNISDGSDAGLT